MKSGSEREAAVALVADGARAVGRDPGDLEALARLAGALLALGRRAEAGQALDVLAGLARETGQAALALSAAKLLEKAGDPARARQHVSALSRTYAATSPRVDRSARPGPPRPPAPRIRFDLETGDDAEDAAGAEGLAVERALAGIGQAAARLAEIDGRARVPAVPLLSALSPAAVERLALLMIGTVRRPGERIVTEGEEARALYLVGLGTLAVSRGGHELGTLRAGTFFGEIALLTGTRRTAEVTCAEETWLLEVPRAALESAAAQAPGLADALADHARRRLLANTMRTSELFIRLPLGEREALMRRFEARVHDPGTVILRQGEAGERLHLVVSGTVDVRRDGVRFASLGPGELVGEMSLIGRKPAVADVVARDRTVTLSLDRASFDEVALAHPQVLAEVYRVIVARDAEVSATRLIVEEEEVVT